MNVHAYICLCIFISNIYSFQRVIYYTALEDVVGVVQQWLSEEGKGENLIVVKLMSLRSSNLVLEDSSRAAALQSMLHKIPEEVGFNLGHSNKKDLHVRVRTRRQRAEFLSSLSFYVTLH